MALLPKPLGPLVNLLVEVNPKKRAGVGVQNVLNNECPSTIRLKVSKTN